MDCARDSLLIFFSGCCNRGVWLIRWLKNKGWYRRCVFSGHCTLGVGAFVVGNDAPGCAESTESSSGEEIVGQLRRNVANSVFITTNTARLGGGKKEERRRFGDYDTEEIFGQHFLVCVGG